MHLLPSSPTPLQGGGGTQVLHILCHHCTTELGLHFFISEDLPFLSFLEQSIYSLDMLSLDSRALDR